MSLRRWAMNHSIPLSVVSFFLAGIGVYHLAQRSIARTGNNHSLDALEIVENVIAEEISEIIVSRQRRYSNDFDFTRYQRTNQVGGEYDVNALARDLALYGYEAVTSSNKHKATDALITSGRLSGLQNTLEAIQEAREMQKR